MLVASFGLGVVLVCVANAVMTGAQDEGSGMLSGLNDTGHETGGSIGIAVLATIAASSAGFSTPTGLSTALTAPHSGSPLSS